VKQQTPNNAKKRSNKPPTLPLDFEEVVSALLKIKPVDNTELKKPKPKKKSKSTK
jgi:hypothetical protein